MQQISLDFDSLKNELNKIDSETSRQTSSKTTPESKSSSSDIIEKESAEPKVYSVSEVNEAIRKNLESKFPTVWLKGEISNFKPHTSGHFYFSLKDQKSQINAIMFRSFNQRLKFRPESGMEVMVRGKITVYEPRGTYQIFCESMDPVGAGAMQMAFEQLKKKLAAEGLFDAAKKRALPELPKQVALVTSPTGAAVRDMINVLNRRFKSLEIIVVPCLVQGDGAPKSIVEALKTAQQLPNLDVVIVGRGGGSIEDLWAFNSEAVARAIAACRVPIVSAVGHEVDFTIADFVADLRAPTPSAAAELIVKNAGDLIERIQNLKSAIYQSIKHQLEVKGQQVSGFSGRLIDPQRNLQDLMLRCDELSARLNQSMRGFFKQTKMFIEIKKQKLKDPTVLIQNLKAKIETLNKQASSQLKTLLVQRREELKGFASLLESLSPLAILTRGYSIVKKAGAVVSKGAQLKSGDEVEIVLSDAKAKAKII
jgi:exodeoxyribonuclease VII large subunit